MYCYYLFDGDVKDCSHPFSITFKENKVEYIQYYSSERIKNGEPIYINSKYSCYNQYILHEYEAKFVYESNNLEEFTVLCDAIHI